MALAALARKYQTPILTEIESVSVRDYIPDSPDGIDYDPISQIRTMPLLDGIDLAIDSELREDVELLVDLLGGYCSEDSMTKIVEAAHRIHDSFKNQSKPANIVKSWVRLLQGLHPRVDYNIRNTLAFFSVPYSEVVGTNTILYYQDLHSNDLSQWNQQPLHTSNVVTWIDTYPSKIDVCRGSLREKLPNECIEYMSIAATTLNRLYGQRLISEHSIVTKNDTGGLTKISRPINPSTAHGAALNSDWYHSAYRIYNNQVKLSSALDVTYQFHKDGYFVHMLINHLVPLSNNAAAAVSPITLADPVGVEDKFPGATVLTIDVQRNGQRWVHRLNPDTPEMVDQFPITPEENINPIQ